VTVGVHQSSELRPLLFISVLESLSSKFRGDLALELLYADDLVADTKELLGEQINSLYRRETTCR